MKILQRAPDIKKTNLCHIFLCKNYTKTSTRSITYLRSVFLEMSNTQTNEWWIGLPEELQKDIEFEE